MNGFLGQAVRGKKRDGKSPDKQMFAFNLPTLRLKVRVDSGNACRQTLVFRDEKNIRIVSSERLDVVDRRQRTPQAPNPQSVPP